MSEQSERDAVVAEAISFEQTRYHHMGRLKIKRAADGSIIDRGGVDCAQLPYLTYFNVGLIPEIPVEYYPEDWFMHHDEERYLATVSKYAHEVAAPLPGDLAVWRFGRCYAHGGIVITPGWPDIVHVLKDVGSVIRDRGDGGRCAEREHKFFSLW